MAAKLHIDVSQGVLNVEGEEAFVKSVYDDFKGRLADSVRRPPLEVIDASLGVEKAVEVGAPQQRKRKPSVRRSSDSTKSKIADYSPKFNPNLDLAKLEEFYSTFDLKNHREKILIFAVFLRDVLGKAPCEADEIFSCYQTVKTKTEIPEAFVQALRDAQNKGGYIEFVSPQEIKITIAGENYFNQKIKRKELAK